MVATLSGAHWPGTEVFPDRNHVFLRPILVLLLLKTPALWNVYQSNEIAYKWLHVEKET